MNTNTHQHLAATACLIACLSAQLAAGDESARKLVDSIPQAKFAGLQPSAIGVTRNGTEIPCFVCQEDFDYDTPKTRVLLVGGLDDGPASVQAAMDVLGWFYDPKDQAAAALRAKFALSAVPCVNPDGIRAGKAPLNLSGGNPSQGYPPAGNAYSSPTDPEAAYLWRWIGMHAPDLVVVLESGKSRVWKIPAAGRSALLRLAAELKPIQVAARQDSLAVQLVQAKPAETGTVPAVKLQTNADDTTDAFQALLAAVDASRWQPSPARRELQQRLKRSPVEVAGQLSKHYGHKLGSVVYIPAVALIGRIRLGELTGDGSHLADVERIAAPYFAGKKSSQPKSGSALSGHLVFAELARVTEGERRGRYVELAGAAAKLGFDEAGKPKPSMPFHVEMSDAVFMGGPILARVGRLTGEQRYFDAAAQHVAFMQQLCLRDDGLYRHSPLDEAAWGRGNGFPALGLAMCLTDWPEGHPGRSKLVAAHRAHLKALLAHQDPNGCWHQVIDKPGSYRELTSTCMITFAMIRGVRLGWLDRKLYEPAIRRAWSAIKTRVRENGRLVDVCTGTGKQKNLRAYYDRTAILGPDDRGGAMALLVSTEMARWEQGEDRQR